MKPLNSLIIVLTVCILCSCQKSTEADTSLIPVKKNEGEWIFINQKGDVALETTPKLYGTSFFYDGISLVQINDGSSSTLSYPYTFLNTKGEFITDKKYKYATIFSEGIAWVVENNGYPSAISKKGDVLFSLKTAERVGIFTEGLAPVCFSEDGIEAWGYVDTNGETIILPSFLKSSGFNKGLAPAVKDEAAGWGYINKKGEFVIQQQFAVANCFGDNGLAVVGIGELDIKYGLIDKSGKYVVSPQYDLFIPDGDKYIVKVGGVYGWINQDGKVLINPQFKAVVPFGKSDVAGVAIDGSKYGLVDKSGKYVLNPQYDRILSYIGEIAPFQMGGKLGFIDKKGGIIINPLYTDIQYDYLYNYMGVFAYDYTSDNKSHAVKTDYFNANSIVSNLLKGTESGTFRGINKHTTFKQIKDAYGDLAYDSASSRKSNNKIDLGNGVSISQIIFSFPDKLSEYSYNYYDNVYENQENTEQAIASVEYRLSVDYSSKAWDKKENLMEEIIKGIMMKDGASTEYTPVVANSKISIQTSSFNVNVQNSGSTIYLTITFN